MTELEKDCITYMSILGFYSSYGYTRPLVATPDGKNFVCGIDCIDKRTEERFRKAEHPDEETHYLKPAEIVPFVRKYIPEAFISHKL